MPHRLHPVLQATNFLFEGILYFVIAAKSGLSLIGNLISDSDWDKITGEHGVIFLLLCVLIVNWNNARIRERNENRRQAAASLLLDKRHTEALDLQRDYTDAVRKIQEASIRSTTRVAIAVDLLSENLKAQTIALKDCPFRAEDFKPKN